MIRLSAAPLSLLVVPYIVSAAPLLTMACRAVTTRCTSVLRVHRAGGTGCHVQRLSSVTRTRRWLSTAAATHAAPKINMALVKQLREQSGAPITECKEAVAAATTTAQPDSPAADLLTLATDILRKRGVSTASKKAGRVASEGLVSVGISADRKRGVLVEMNSETDFAARNERFQSTLQQLAATALTAVQPATLQSTEQAESESESALLTLLSASSEGKTVKDVMADTVTTLRENIQLRRVAALAVDGEGAIGSYVHNAVTTAASSSSTATRLGRTATLVGLSFKPNSSSSPSVDQSSLVSLANKLAMQITASPPTYLSRHHIPPATLQHERTILEEQSKAKAADTSSKPGQPPKQAKPVDAKQLERIVTGRLNKYYEEVCLLDQLLVVSVGGEGEGGDGQGVGKVRVSGMLSDEGKKRGGVLEVVGFVRYTVGEGVKKPEAKMTFAEEVANKLNK